MLLERGVDPADRLGSRHCSSRKISTPNWRDRTGSDLTLAPPPSIAGQVPAGLPAKPGLGKTWTSQARAARPQAHQQQLSSQNYRSCSGPPWTLRKPILCPRKSGPTHAVMRFSPPCRNYKGCWCLSDVGREMRLDLVRHQLSPAGAGLSSPCPVRCSRLCSTSNRAISPVIFRARPRRQVLTPESSPHWLCPTERTARTGLALYDDGASTSPSFGSRDIKSALKTESVEAIRGSTRPAPVTSASKACRSARAVITTWG